MTRQAQPVARPAGQGNTFKFKTLSLAVAACLGSVAPAALANPSGAAVANGTATFATDGNTLTVTNSNGAIINWRQFNIGATETTRFVQPNAQSSVLNRVVGGDPSQILGTLQSNGQVFLINPNGIVFGRNSVIDVPGLIASTLNLSDTDFLNRKFSFSGGGFGPLVNQGRITTPLGGSVMLIGSEVRNEGVITTPQGQVVLAAGNSVSLIDTAGPELSVTINAGTNKAVNLGEINAAGGRIDIFGALIEQQGVLRADSASVDEQGRIVLKATEGTTVSGAVSATNSAGQGGSIQVLGKDVTLTPGASLDASGANGGGQVLVGGDWQGKNPAVANAQTTTMAAGAVIKADATDRGNGGKVVLWSDRITDFKGSIFARGGTAGGDGGRVETSGHILRLGGTVDTRAPRGATGFWLLDPAVVCLDTSGCAGGAYDPLAKGYVAADVTYVTPTALNSMLLSSDVFVSATDYAAILPNGGTWTATSGIPAGRILDVSAPFIYVNGTLDLRTNSARAELHLSALTGSSASFPSQSNAIVLGGSTNLLLPAGVDGQPTAVHSLSANTVSIENGAQIDAPYVYGVDPSFGYTYPVGDGVAIQAGSLFKTAGGSVRAKFLSLTFGTAGGMFDYDASAGRMTLDVDGLNVFTHDSGGFQIGTETCAVGGCWGDMNNYWSGTAKHLFFNYEGTGDLAIVGNFNPGNVTEAHFAAPGRIVVNAPVVSAAGLEFDAAKIEVNAGIDASKVRLNATDYVAILPGNGTWQAGSGISGTRILDVSAPFIYVNGTLDFRTSGVRINTDFDALTGTSATYPGYSGSIVLDTNARMLFPAGVGGQTYVNHAFRARNIYVENGAQIDAPYVSYTDPTYGHTYFVGDDVTIQADTLLSTAGGSIKARSLTLDLPASASFDASAGRLSLDVANLNIYEQDNGGLQIGTDTCTVGACWGDMTRYWSGQAKHMFLMYSGTGDVSIVGDFNPGNVLSFHVSAPDRLLVNAPINPGAYHLALSGDRLLVNAGINSSGSLSLLGFHYAKIDAPVTAAGFLSVDGGVWFSTPLADTTSPGLYINQPLKASYIEIGTGRTGTIQLASTLTATGVSSAGELYAGSSPGVAGSATYSSKSSDFDVNDLISIDLAADDYQSSTTPLPPATSTFVNTAGTNAISTSRGFWHIDVPSGASVDLGGLSAKPMTWDDVKAAGYVPWYNDMSASAKALEDQHNGGYLFYVNGQPATALVDPCALNPASCAPATTSTATTTDQSKTVTSPAATASGTTAGNGTTTLSGVLSVDTKLVSTSAGSGGSTSTGATTTTATATVAQTSAVQESPVAVAKADGEKSVAEVQTEAKQAKVEAQKAELESKAAEAEARKAESEARQAETEAKSARTAEAKEAARQRAETKKVEAQMKKAEAEAKRAEAEAKLAEAEGREALAQAKETKGDTAAPVAAKQAQAEAKQAEAQARKAEAEGKQAAIEAREARNPDQRAVAQKTAEAKKAEAEGRRAEAQAKAMEAEAKQAEAEAKTAPTPEARAAAERRAESKRMEAEVKKSDAESRLAQAESKQAEAQGKQADVRAKEARAEAKQAEAEVKSARTPEQKLAATQKAEVKKTEAEAYKTEAEARKVQAEGKKIEAEAKRADAEAKKAEAEVKTAKAPEQKAAAEKRVEAKRTEADIKRSEAEAKRTEAEAKQTQAEAKSVEAEAKGMRSAGGRLALLKEVEAKRADAEHKQAEAAVKKAEAEVKKVEAVVRKAEATGRRDEANARKGEIEAKRAEVAVKRAEAEKKRVEAEKKIQEHRIAMEKRREERRAETTKAFAAVVTAGANRAALENLAALRHELKTETLKPALNILKANPAAADLPPCGAGSTVCIPVAAQAAAATLPPPLQPKIAFLPQIQRKVAVVIGVNKYDDPSIPSLESALPDAKSVGQQLQEQLGYDVRVVPDASRADIVTSLNKLSQEVGPNDSVTVYYAGHGYMSDKTKTGYWIPADAKVTSPDKWISNGDIGKLLSNIPAKQVMLVSDSCYSGSLTKEQKIVGAATSFDPSGILAKRSVTVMSSGGEEPVSDEGKEGHSIFAYSFMSALKSVKQVDSGAKLFQAVRDEVSKDFPQTPQYGGAVSAGHAPGGDYLLEARSYK